MHYRQFSRRIHGYDRKAVSLSNNNALSIFCHITNTLISQIFDLQHNECPPFCKYMRCFVYITDKNIVEQASAQQYEIYEVCVSLTNISLHAGF